VVLTAPAAVFPSDHFLEKYSARRGDRNPVAVAASNGLICGTLIIETAYHNRLTANVYTIMVNDTLTLPVLFFSINFITVTSLSTVSTVH
jgi:hypothetical protein